MAGHQWGKIKPFHNASDTFHGRQCVACGILQRYGKRYGSKKHSGFESVSDVCESEVRTCVRVSNDTKKLLVKFLSRRPKRVRKRMEDVLNRLRSPVPTPGTWVLTRDFTGRKSFGCFKCPACDKKWFSAHAWAKYTQGCNVCDCNTKPFAMWVNTCPSTTQEGKVFKGSPHDKDRCQACWLGVCVNTFGGIP